MFSKDIGIDLGTANTLVYMKGKGIIIREPSVVAVDTKSDKVKCVGQEAKDVIGRTPGSIVTVRPLKDGVIADFDVTTSMLTEFIHKAIGKSFFSRRSVTASWTWISTRKKCLFMFSRDFSICRGGIDELSCTYPVPGNDHERSGDEYSRPRGCKGNRII